MSPLCAAALGWALAQPVEAPADWESEELPRDLVKLYGFVDGYVEKAGAVPVRNQNGTIRRQTPPHEFDVLGLHILAQGLLFGRYRFFVNLAGPGSGGPIDTPLNVRNAWVEFPLAGDYANLRLGKTYRRFGLYNEILDASPTFIGIEPPELFDPDHLMLTRTTNLMLHGAVPLGSGQISYAVSTGDDERIRNAVPFGADLRFESGQVTVGSSFYTTGGPAAPRRGLTEGSPVGGVLPWMEEDWYVVYGGFLEVDTGRFLFQLAGWRADHRARRSAAGVLALHDTPLSDDQRARLGLQGDSPTEEDVIQGIRYTARTAYLRSGYAIPLGSRADAWELTPYLQFDVFGNPETVSSKAVGGDPEAGISDTGHFAKGTAGIVLRPVPAVALKLDGSAHVQPVDGRFLVYPEVRLSYSVFWDLWSR